jgi:hypothetical protein
MLRAACLCALGIVCCCMHAARRAPHTAHRAVLPAQAGHLPAGRHRRARPAARRSPCPFVPGGVGWVDHPTCAARAHRCGMTACVRCLEKHRTCSGCSRSGAWCVVFRVRRRCCISTLLGQCAIGSAACAIAYAPVACRRARRAVCRHSAGRCCWLARYVARRGSTEWRGSLAAALPAT